MGFNVKQFKKILSQRHPERNAKKMDASGQVKKALGEKKPADKPHVRADTQKPLNYRLEKSADHPSVAALHAKYPRAGQQVDGRDVMDEVPNQSSIGASLSNYRVLDGVREFPMSELDGDPKSLFYAADDHRRTRDLAQQIHTNKKISPLIIAVDKDGPYVIEGAHRLGALHALGAKSFPAQVVVDLDNPPAPEIKKSEDRAYSHADVVASAKKAGNPDIMSGSDFSARYKPDQIFQVQYLPVSSLWRGKNKAEVPSQPLHWESSEDEGYAQGYAQNYPSGLTAEPIIAHPHEDGSYQIIDGRHRARAAYLRREKDIRAFVPVKKSEVLRKPFKSEAQRRYFHWAAAHGKDGITPKMAHEWESATPPGKKLPEKLDKGSNGNWQKEGYRLEYHAPQNPSKKYPASHRVYAYDKDNNRVGTYILHLHPETKELTVNNSETEEPHRRKGLANAAYTLVGQKTGGKFVPIEGQQTKAAQALWSSPKRTFGKSVLQKGRNGDWQQEGYKLSHSNPADNRFGLVTVNAHAPNGETAGFFTFDPEDPKGIFPVQSHVHKEHRRKGLASAAYSYIENLTGKKVIPSTSQTPDAEKLWNQKNRQFGKSDLEKEAKGDWRSEGYKIKVNDSDPDNLEVVALDPSGRQVGEAFIDHANDKKHIYSSNTRVHPEHQRKGLATAMYMAAEKYTGKKIAPSDSFPEAKDGVVGQVSPSGKRLWNQPNRPFGKSLEKSWAIKIKGKTGYHPVKDVVDMGSGNQNSYRLHDGTTVPHAQVEDLDMNHKPQVSPRPTMAQVKKMALRKQNGDLEKVWVHQHNVNAASNHGINADDLEDLDYKGHYQIGPHKIHVYHDYENDSHKFVAQDDKGNPIGILKTAPSLDMYEKHGEAPPATEHSFVEPEFRGQGIGGALYQAALAHHKQLYSSNALSPHSDKMWRNLKKIPGVKMRAGRLNTNQQHVAEYKTGAAPKITPARKSLSKTIDKLRKGDGVKSVSVVGVMDNGTLLMGRRRDNGCYTFPGGSANEGEAPEAAARRELFEETGLKPQFLHYMGKRTSVGLDGNPCHVHVYICRHPHGEAHGRNDPDREVAQWESVPVSKGMLPAHVEKSLHVPRERNAILQTLSESYKR